MRRLTKILIGVGVALLLIAVLVLTLVVVLRKEEWIVLERSFSGLNDHCTAEWAGSSDWRRTRCKMPFICAAARDQQKGYCRLPLSEGEGKSCAASVHLCSTGLACDPYLKICRRLISVGGSCTEQNAFLCETGICGYAAMQTVEGEPVGGRHSLSRYCIVKDLPPGAACDRFRHCVTDCLQCVQGICKPVMTPMDQQQLLLEKQKELMLPLAVNGFSADEQQQTADSEAPLTGRNLQQARQSPWEASLSENSLSRQREQVPGQQHPQEVPTNSENKLTMQTVRQAWDQRAAEVSSLLGEKITAEDLAAFFAVPRDADGQPLRSPEAEAGHEESIAGQQANSYGAPPQLQGLQQQQLPGGLAPAGPRPLLTGSLAKRLAKLFAGVSYAFTPESQQGNFASALASPAFGFPSAVPPPIPPGLASAALERNAYGSSVFGSEMPTEAMSLPQQEQLAAQLQRLQQQHSLYHGGFSPFDSSLEAMEAASGTGEGPQKKSSSEGETGELEGLFFPGLPNTNPLQPGLPGRPIPRPLASLGVPPLSLQRPAVSSRLPPLLSPLSAVPPVTIPPLGSAPLGSSAIGSLPLGSSQLGSLPLMPQNPNLQLPLTQAPNYNTPTGTIPGLPSRLPEYKGGCWVDRCCASHHYCSFLHATQGCQPRKREGAPCVGDSARECEDRLSCVNGECSPWFTSRHASAGDPIILTDNVDLDSVCAPWQRFEIGHASHSPHLHDLMPPQMALPSPLETPNPYGNNLAADVVRTFRKFSGRCVTLDKRSCVTDRECWGVGGFGFCDVRSKKCRSPTYPGCLSMLKDLYSCLWYEGRLRETTDEYIVSQVPRTPQFLLHEAPVSVNHVQSKCIPSQVRRKRAEFLKCVQDQGFTLERIVEVPEDWYQG